MKFIVIVYSLLTKNCTRGIWIHGSAGTIVICKWTYTKYMDISSVEQSELNGKEAPTGSLNIA